MENILVFDFSRPRIKGGLEIKANYIVLVKQRI